MIPPPSVLGDITSFTNEGVCRLIFPPKPLLAIMNNKQAEYINSAGSNQAAWHDLGEGGWASLQYLKRTLAEMETGRSGGIHYQGTQLHLEIVVAISNCHL